MNNGHLVCLIVFLLLIILLIPSCDNSNSDPEFAGSWQFTGKITSDNLVYNTTRTIILTKKTFEETYVIQRENSPAVTAIVGTMGSLGTSHSNLIFKLEGLGTCVLDEMDACTGDVQWFGRGTFYWINNIMFFEETVTGEFEISGTTLRLVRDLNNDGDNKDTGEDVTFQMI
jgi:hypothetical protein